MPQSRESSHEHYFGHQHVTLIRPAGAFSMVNYGELWAYRGLLLSLAARQVRVRYKQTVLGAAWAVIQPVTQMVIFSLIFGRMAKLPSEGFPYPIFVYSGLLAWNYFAAATGSAAGSLVSNAHLVSKVYFPRLIIPFAAVLAGLVDFAIASLVMVGLMLFYGTGVSAGLLAAPFLVLAVMLTAAGVGTALGAANVAFRDLQHAMPFMMQVWMYATPVVYPADAIPPSLQWVIALNPMTGITDAFRAAFLGKPFDFAAIALSVGVAAVIFVLGTLYFQHVERRFADVI